MQLPVSTPRLIFFLHTPTTMAAQASEKLEKLDRMLTFGAIYCIMLTMLQ